MITTYADLQAQVNALRNNGAQLVVLLSHEGFTLVSEVMQQAMMLLLLIMFPELM